MLLKRSAAALALGLALAGHALAAGSEPPPFNPPQKSVPRDTAGQGRALFDRFKGEPEKAPRGRTKSDKRSEWRDDYRAAVSLIQAARYDDAIVTLTSLDKADSPDVLNYIGYANRKMGRMEAARASYEGALALDPDHRGALEYYGEWHVEMGKLDGARGFLMRLAMVCGTACREYQDLADAIAAKTSH